MATNEETEKFQRQRDLLQVCVLFLWGFSSVAYANRSEVRAPRISLQKFGIDCRTLSLNGFAWFVGAHETMGMGWAVGSWALCYKYQPALALTESVPMLKNNPTIQRWWALASVRASAMRNSSKYDLLAKNLKVDPPRFFASFAEAVVLRKLVMPLSVPGKIYLAYQLAKAMAPSSALDTHSDT